MDAKKTISFVGSILLSAQASAIEASGVHERGAFSSGELSSESVLINQPEEVSYKASAAENLGMDEEYPMVAGQKYTGVDCMLLISIGAPSCN